jgi:hypothetical protein
MFDVMKHWCMQAISVVEADQHFARANKTIMNRKHDDMNRS